MAREKPPPKDDSGDIPAWFMTYSDVITLLMTFFILLLTFASQEPEQFERMKISMFGGGGSDGFAGEAIDSMDREALVSRYRPRVSRLSRQGTETPPMTTDASQEGLNKGLKALEENSDLAQFERLTFSASRNSILNSSGELTRGGASQLKKMAAQLTRFPMHLSIAVSDPDDREIAVQMAYDMTFRLGAKLGQISVSTDESKKNRIEFTMTRER